MGRLQVGVIRYSSIATQIVRAIGADPAPECRIGQARITLTFRRHGATRWSEERQTQYALRVAAIARAVMAQDPRATVRQRATRAIVVVYEDSTLVRECAVVARWECVVPSHVRATE